MTVIDDNISTSPSVYVIYSSVSAGNGCSTIGGNYRDITLSYGANELSTIQVPGNAAWKFTPGVASPTKTFYRSFNFADLSPDCPPVSDTDYIDPKPPSCAFSTIGHDIGIKGSESLDQACNASIASIASNYQSLVRQCYPSLEYPFKLRALEPAWAACDAVSSLRLPVFDPPRALIPATALTNPTPVKKALRRATALPGSGSGSSWPVETNAVGNARNVKTLDGISDAPNTMPAGHIAVDPTFDPANLDSAGN